jgi:hypothetical protein
MSVDRLLSGAAWSSALQLLRDQAYWWSSSIITIDSNLLCKSIYIYACMLSTDVLYSSVCDILVRGFCKITRAWASACKYTVWDWFCDMKLTWVHLACMYPCNITS